MNRSDLKKRQRFLQKELKIIQLKTLYHDVSLPKPLRLHIQLKLANLSFNTKYKVKNRCIVSGRGKGVYKKLGISRILLRELGHEGYVLGLSKASW